MMHKNFMHEHKSKMGVPPTHEVLYWLQISQHQLQKAAKDKGYTDTVFFVDDGITGTTMKRPGFQKMLTAIEAGYISAVFVKDLSRLGRNYI